MECPICGRTTTYREKVYKKRDRGHFFEVDSQCATYDVAMF